MSPVLHTAPAWKVAFEEVFHPDLPVELCQSVHDEFLADEQKLSRYHFDLRESAENGLLADSPFAEFESGWNRVHGPGSVYTMEEPLRELSEHQMGLSRDFTGQLRRLPRDLGVRDYVALDPKPDEADRFADSPLSFFRAYLPFYRDGDSHADTYGRRARFLTAVVGELAASTEDPGVRSRYQQFLPSERYTERDPKLAKAVEAIYRME